MKKDIIRIGDKVRIVEPEVFVRCGYPMGKKHAEEWYKSNEKEIENFFYNIELDLNNSNVSRFKFQEQLYGLYLKSHGFGGNTRKIYTERDEAIRGIEVVVWGKYIKRSGVRVMDKIKGKVFKSDGTHIVLRVGADSDDQFGMVSRAASGFYILSKNVVKVEDSTEKARKASVKNNLTQPANSVSSF
jgi:hypothetical protein